MFVYDRRIDNNAQWLTTSKTKCRKSCTMTQKLNVGHCGSVCRRYATVAKKYPEQIISEMIELMNKNFGERKINKTPPKKTI